MNSFGKNFDAIIIGGGIIGMLTAHQLQKQGLNVAIFDKGKLGGEATWAAGGILSPLNPWQINTNAQILIDEGKRKFAALAEELTQETGINPEHLRSGMLVLDISEDEYQTAHQWAKNNDEPIEKISQKTLFQYEPNLVKTFHRALSFPNIAQVRPPKLISALHLSLLQRSISVFENTAVKELILDSNTVVGILTQNKKVYAETVIMCSGAWTKYISTLNQNIEIEPVRGQMLLFKPDKKLLSHILLREKTYLIPRQDGHILCGSTLEHVGFENDVTEQAKDELQTFACQLVPELMNYEVKQQWSALRPGTKRDAPYICKHPAINGLFLNSGHYRYGIVMSIASARLTADLVTNSLNRSHTVAFA